MDGGQRHSLWRRSQEGQGCRCHPRAAARGAHSQPAMAHRRGGDGRQPRGGGQVALRRPTGAAAPSTRVVAGAREQGPRVYSGGVVCGCGVLPFGLTCSCVVRRVSCMTLPSALCARGRTVEARRRRRRAVRRAKRSFVGRVACAHE